MHTAGSIAVTVKDPHTVSPTGRVAANDEVKQGARCPRFAAAAGPGCGCCGAVGGQVGGLGYRHRTNAIYNSW